MVLKGITLRGLEVFEALARTGSVAQAAQLTGLSQPSVSQQVRNLEAALNIELVDHGRRPMQLTPAGTLFLGRAEQALKQLRLAQSELTVMNLAHLDALCIGIIDDFDDNLTPRLATILNDSLSGCALRMITASSYNLLTAVRTGDLHLAISASARQTMDGIVEKPLAEDPFMIVAPAGFDTATTGFPDGAQLAFLRYDKDQLIAQQIEKHLAAHSIDLPDRFQIGSHLALMAMVARGIGWAITTPLGYMRAHRFHDRLSVHPLPILPFSRRISLFAGSDWDHEVPNDIARTMRRLILTHMIAPALASYPFLSGQLTILEDPG
jgi:DNA-binding transcriptional LysR family regulator